MAHQRGGHCPTRVLGADQEGPAEDGVADLVDEIDRGPAGKDLRIQCWGGAGVGGSGENA